MIPPFNLSGHLPPFTGLGPHLSSGRAPYMGSLLELFSAMGHTAARRTLIDGLLRYRTALRTFGYEAGFHWIDGSFTEDCEKLRSRDPSDIDLVSFVRRPSAFKTNQDWDAHVQRNLATFGALIGIQAKAAFGCDAYIVHVDEDPFAVVAQTHYWFGLFSHQKATGVWKGMIHIPFDQLDIDDQATAAALTFASQQAAAANAAIGQGAQTIQGGGTP